MPSLISALEKVINRDVQNIIVSTLKSLVFGYRYYDNRKKENETYLDYWNREIKKDDDDNIEDGEDTGGEEKKESRKIAPKDMQEQLKNIVLKSRSPIERERAIIKTDDAFLVEQIKNPKQMQRVRLYALNYAPPEAIDDIVKNMDDPIINVEAIKKCKNKDIILKYTKDTGNYSELWKLDAKTILDNFPPNFKFEMLKGIGANRGYYRNSRDGDFRRFLSQLKDPKDIIFVLDKCFSAEDYEGEKGYNSPSGFILPEMIPLLKKLKDKKVCKDIISTKNIKYAKLQAFIVLFLKDDKSFIKGILDVGQDIDQDVKKLILEILDDQSVYKEEVVKKIKKDKSKKQGDDDDYDYDNVDGYNFFDLVPFCLLHIKDEKFVKDVITKFSLSLPTVVKTIHDEDFLKKYFSKTEDPTALTNVTDDAYLKEQYTKDKDLLKYIKDEKFLKKTYEDLLENTPDTSRHYERDSWGMRRADSLDNIKDQDFLIKVAKNDPSYVTRKNAIKHIKDVATVEKFLLRETSKNGKREILEVIDNQDILMRFIKKQKDPEIRGWAYNKLDADSIAKLVSEKIDVPQIEVDKMDMGDLEKLIEKDDEIADRYITLVSKDEDFILKMLKKRPSLAKQVVNEISSEKVLKKLLIDENALHAFDSYEKITDHALLEYILLNKNNMYVNDISDMFMQLNPSQEFLKKLIENAQDNVAKEAANFITDVDFMIDVINSTEVTYSTLIEHMYKKVWPHIKGNLEKIKKLTKTKNLFVIEKILPSLANQDDALAQVVKSLRNGGYQSDNLVVKAISLLSDKKQIVKMLPNLSMHQLEDIDPTVVRDWLYTSKDVDFKKAYSLIHSGGKKINPLELYNVAKSDNVKSAAIIQVKKNDFPESITKDIVNHFISGVQNTDRPYEISKDVIKLIYDVATDQQQDILAGYLDAKHLNERHRDALQRTYLTPKKGKETITPLEHGVEKVPIQQLFRLLVHLAR